MGTRGFTTDKSAGTAARPVSLLALLALALLMVSGTRASAQVIDPAGRGKPMVTLGSYNQPPPAVEVGTASWYGGPTVRGHHTANGERFDEGAMTAAHPTLPFASLVRVTNLGNGRSVVVRINDRNATYTGRVIDLSRKAGELLGLRSAGIGVVAIVPLTGDAPPTRVATETPQSGRRPTF